MNNLSDEQLWAIRMIFSTLTPDNVRCLLYSNGFADREIKRAVNQLRDVYNTLNQKDETSNVDLS